MYVRRDPLLHRVISLAGGYFLQLSRHFPSLTLVSLIGIVGMLKDWTPRGGDPQAKRRTTLLLQNFNELIAARGLLGDFPEPPRTGRGAFGLDADPSTDPRDIESRDLPYTGLAGQSWGIVGEHPDIAAPRRWEKYLCRHAAAKLGFCNDNLERLRIEDLNLWHAAWLESLTGKHIEVEDYTGDGHAVGDMEAQAAAGDMEFEDVGRHTYTRRDRTNEFLEDTEKLLTKGKRKGKTYRPNKAEPGRTLTGDELMTAVAALRPPKKGSLYFSRFKPTAPKERGVFGSWKTEPIETYVTTNKEASAYTPDDDRENNPRYQINVPEGWFVKDQDRGHGLGEAHSYADELMTLKSKKPIPHKWGATLFGKRLVYGTVNLELNYEDPSEIPPDTTTKIECYLAEI